MELYTSKQWKATSTYLNVTDNVKITFEAIASLISAQNLSCFPKYATLAKRTGFSVRTVIRHVKTLVKKGLITKKANHYLCKRSGQRRQSSNTYKLNPLKIYECIVHVWTKQGKKIYTPQQWAMIKSKSKVNRNSLNKKDVTGKSDDVSPSSVMVLKGTDKPEPNNALQPVVSCSQEPVDSHYSAYRALRERLFK